MKKVLKMKIFTISCLIASTLLLAGCHTIMAPILESDATTKPHTEATTLTVLETQPLKGSDNVTIHAYAYTRGSDHCARTIALSFSSSLNYTQTMIALRNRALVTGANALSITDWREHFGITTLTGHFFDCHSKKGL